MDRIGLAYAAGRDGFWLARWLRAHGIEAYGIHPEGGGVALATRANTDRLEPAMLERVPIKWSFDR